MKFSKIEKIAKDLGLSPQGIERVLGQIWIEVTSPEGQKKRFNLGLRLEVVMRESRWVPHKFILAALREYQNASPLIFRWLVSGGFNPSRLPQDLSYPQVLHASRTSGRLRAALLRKLSSF